MQIMLAQQREDLRWRPLENVMENGMSKSDGQVLDHALKRLRRFPEPLRSLGNVGPQCGDKRRHHFGGRPVAGLVEQGGSLGFLVV